jgi:hypothetical protein
MGSTVDEICTTVQKQNITKKTKTYIPFIYNCFERTVGAKRADGTELHRR